MSGGVVKIFIGWVKLNEEHLVVLGSQCINVVHGPVFGGGEVEGGVAVGGRVRGAVAVLLEGDAVHARAVEQVHGL